VKVFDRRNGVVEGLLVVGTTVALSALLGACGGAGDNQAQGGATGEAPGETTRQQGQAEPTGQQAAANVDWNAVGQAIGKKGEMKDGVYRVGLPRKDLEVTSGGVKIEPSLALGSYAAFVPMPNGEAMVMGDLVLTEDELNPVVSSLQENGLAQTAVHKHLPEQDPPVWWQHFEGTGDPVELAQAVNEALSLTGTPMEASSSEPKDLGLDTARLDEIIGRKGENTGTTYNFSVPRAEPVSVDGVEVPASAGVATALNFQPTGGGKAAINGDFVMTEEEVDPVLRTLRENGIEVVALHNHTLGEEPRLFYTHFWANDDAEKLAEGLKAALDKTNSA
jgi:hypothetical protein